MKHEVKIGVICIASKTFDYNAAKEIYEKIQKDIKGIENVSWEIIPELIIEIEDSQKDAQHLDRYPTDCIPDGVGERAN